VVGEVPVGLEGPREGWARGGDLNAGGEPVDTHEVRGDGGLDPGTETEVEAVREALRAQQQVVQRLAETVPVGVLLVDALGRVVYANDRVDDIFGSARAATLEEQLATVMERDRPLTETAFDDVLRDGLDGDIEIAVRPPWATDTEMRYCTLHLRALTGHDGEVTGAVVCVTDGTESVSTRDELRLRATFDTLTRCNNRQSTVAALEAMLAGSDEWNRPAAIFVDLDHFKELNEGQGHDAGDEFLGVVARRLRGAVREDDVVGRMGGDQFLVVCPGVATAAEAVRTAIRIAETLSHEVQLKNARIGSRASIGVAWSSGSDADAEALVAKSETAMHESKRRGAGRPVLFTPSLLQAPPRPS
jgi:diguanylate cyclase (GGDEF)-like protein/PAS domain S-box-containing protein